MVLVDLQARAKALEHVLQVLGAGGDTARRVAEELAGGRYRYCLSQFFEAVHPLLLALQHRSDLEEVDNVGHLDAEAGGTLVLVCL